MIQNKIACQLMAILYALCIFLTNWMPAQNAVAQNEGEVNEVFLRSFMGVHCELSSVFLKRIESRSDTKLVLDSK